jgi:hypothetical protein
VSRDTPWCVRRPRVSTAARSRALFHDRDSLETAVGALAPVTTVVVFETRNSPVSLGVSATWVSRHAPRDRTNA